MKLYNVEHTYLDNLLVQKGNLFQIPHYQRRFSWEKKNFEELWNDIDILNKKKEDKSEDKHFLGAFVIITHPHTAIGRNPLEIVDGQQRLTAISVLLCAIRDFFNENQKEKISNIIDKDYLHNTDMEGNLIGTKIELGNLDKKDYENLIKGNHDEIEDTKLFEAYTYFKEKIYELENITSVKEYYNKLLKNIICVIISVDRDSDAYRLFETLNQRGLPLSPIDLIKNYLFRVCNSDKNINIEDIKHYWGKIITNLDQKGVNDIRFFRQYLMSAKKPVTKEKITYNRLYERFKEILDKDIVEKGIIDIKTFINDIRRQSDLYAKICKYKIDLFDSHQNEEINLHLRYLSDIGAIPGYTLLLRAFKELKNWKEILKVILYIEVFSTRRIICEVPTGDLDSIYNHLSTNAFKQENPMLYIKEYLTGRLPDDEEFKKKFYEKDYDNNNQTRYILNILEEKGYSNGVYPSKNVSRFGVHIEHIMSRRLKKNEYRSWLEYLKIDEKKHNDYVYRIGNLTLLEEPFNIGLSNKPFRAKKEFYSSDKTEFAMTHALCNYRVWSPNKIDDRSEEMAEYAVDIWKI